MVHLCGETLYQKVEIFAILGATFPPPFTDWHLHGQADPCAPPLRQISHESVLQVASAGRKCWFLACE